MTGLMNSGMAALQRMRQDHHRIFDHVRAAGECHKSHDKNNNKGCPKMISKKS
jgi:hypothetical protein